MLKWPMAVQCLSGPWQFNAQVGHGSSMLEWSMAVECSSGPWQLNAQVGHGSSMLKFKYSNLLLSKIQHSIPIVEHYPTISAQHCSLGYISSLLKSTHMTALLMISSTAK